MTHPISLDDLTDCLAATERLRAAGLELTCAEPTYVRHKPGETTIVAYRFTVADGDSWGYAQWCADPDRASEIYSKAASMRPRCSAIGAGLTRLDPHTVLYAFPNDARLRRLRWYTTPRKLKRSLESLAAPGQRISGHRTHVQILRYKPERRVVTKVDLAVRDHPNRPLLVRYGTQRQAHRLARIAHSLRAGGINTPAPVAQLDDSRVSVDEFIDGRQLRDAIQADGANGADLAAALQRFHTAPAPPRIDTRTPASDLAKARQGLHGLAVWQPVLGPASGDLIKLLTRTLPRAGARDVLLHGDLHAKNILVADDVISFVDLERVAVGPAAIDLGYFRAHAIALAIRQPGWSPTALDHAEAMIDHYRTATDPIDPYALGWHTAIGLIDQALLVTRHLEDNWSTTSAQLLDAARRQLETQANFSGATP